VSPTSPPGGLDAFNGERPRLDGLAYRITGSLADAEDVVQEAWIPWAARDPGSVDNPAGWLTTVTSRLALDRLRAQRRRGEVYVGPWLPDPVTSRESRRLRTNVDGNPLFLEERFLSLVETGALVKEGTSWSLSHTAFLDVPQVLECLIRSRVDRLPCSSRRY
jgi:DNA-directed RNA polymerase specialized sigma24 family protein